MDDGNEVFFENGGIRKMNAKVRWILLVALVLVVALSACTGATKEEVQEAVQAGVVAALEAQPQQEVKVEVDASALDEVARSFNEGVVNLGEQIAVMQTLSTTHGVEVQIVCTETLMSPIGASVVLTHTVGETYEADPLWVCGLDGEPVLASQFVVSEVVSDTTIVMSDGTLKPEVSDGFCPPAKDLGPWAPNQDGSGENFEVTCNEQICVMTHVQLWWPAGSDEEWGTKEISVRVPAGLSIEVLRGAGKGFEYASSCSLGEIQDQIVADNARRETDTSFYGQVDIDDLIEIGLVTVRFDRRDQQVVNEEVSTSDLAAVSSSMAEQQVCEAKRVGDSDGMTTIEAKADEVLSVEAWGGQLGDAFVIVPTGESVVRTWQGGAIWSYNCTNVQTVVSDLSGRGKMIYVVEGGELVEKN